MVNKTSICFDFLNYFFIKGNIEGTNILKICVLIVSLECFALYLCIRHGLILYA